ncbi:MAG: type II toxin-antitoxin system PemK/MazF family toxin [Deltaproteobacteria bacterium]|nr:type II toxin-antitoxin system PemK/MazF family toxin [Deltaproteobacteria bacterium]
MDVGEIYTVEVPSTNGHEQAGTRPAIVVQAPQFENRLPTVLIIPLTSRLTAQAFPGTFTIHPDTENNLTMPSVALVFQLRAIDKRRLKRRIGRLSAILLAQVHQTMKELLQLP